MPTELILVRHGEVNRPNKKEGFVSGNLDPSLSNQGQVSAEKVARYLSREIDLGALYTSPLKRSIETAAIIAEHTGLQPKIVEDLREWNFHKEMSIFDRVQLLMINVLSRFKPFRYLLCIQWTRSPSLKTFIRKVSNAVQEIIETNPERRVVIVAHGGTIDGILTHYFPDPEQWERGVIKNCSVTSLLVNVNETRIILFNSIDHLQ